MSESPYWGAATARLDFGEPNYLSSPYVAELYNTVSNFGFVALGLLGCARAHRHGLPPAVQIAHALMALTGVASALFHATVRWEYHLFDEVAESWMILALFYLVVAPPRSFPWALFACHGVAMSIMIHFVMGFCEVHLIAMGAPVLWLTSKRYQARGERDRAVLAICMRYLSAGIGVWLAEAALSHRIAELQVQRHV
jgi:hypothetical protein